MKVDDIGGMLLNNKFKLKQLTVFDNFKIN